jgi:cell fate (sporulation/competence/biofilm development) regulator YlbF (YheA/YmcA/DUF963 family)
MLATLERIELLEKADQLTEMILQSDIVEQYRICFNRMQTNIETQQRIQAFIKLKEQYEEVQRFGEYHPDQKKIMKQVRVVKREMDLDENVAAFKMAENDLQTLLDEVSILIGHSVSEQIKVPTGNPFFETSHSGGCGTGGSCGCSTK